MYARILQAVLTVLAALAVLTCPLVSAAGVGGDPAVDGQIVLHEMSGFEPDFDPIDRVVVTAKLSGLRQGAAVLPADTLVLSTYLENFQPDTTPMLPDLLDTNQTATSLGGFMHGKAVLVNAAGHVAYQGSVLAEVFLDNSVHLDIQLDQTNPRGATAALRLLGSFVLDGRLAVHGTLHVGRGSRLVGLDASGHAGVSWQSIVRGLAISPPTMMGTGGGHAQSTPTSLFARITPPTSPGVLTLRLAAFVLGCILTLAALWLWAQPYLMRLSRGAGRLLRPDKTKPTAERALSSESSTLLPPPSSGVPERLSRADPGPSDRA